MASKKQGGAAKGKGSRGTVTDQKAQFEGTNEKPGEHKRDSPEMQQDAHHRVPRGDADTPEHVRAYSRQVGDQYKQIEELKDKLLQGEKDLEHAAEEKKAEAEKVASLQHDIEHLKEDAVEKETIDAKRFEDFEAQVKLLGEEKTKAEREREDEATKVTDLTTKVGELTQEKERIEEDVRTLKHQSKTAEQKVSALDVKLREIAEVLGTGGDELHPLAESIRLAAVEKMADLRSKTRNLDSLKIGIVEVNGQLRDLHQDLCGVGKDQVPYHDLLMKSLKKEASLVRQRCKELAQIALGQVDKLQDGKPVHLLEIAKDAVDRLVKDLEAALSKNTELDKARKSLEADLEDCQQRAKKDGQEAKNRQERDQTRFEDYSKNVQRLEKAEEEATKNNDRWKAHCEEMEKKAAGEKKRLQEDLQKAEKENTSLQRDLANDQDEIKRLNEDVRRVQRENNSLQRDLANAQDEINRLQEDLQKAENYITSVRHDVQDAYRQIDNLVSERAYKEEATKLEASRMAERMRKAEETAKDERDKYNNLLGIKIRQDTKNFQDINDAGRPEVVVKKYQDIACGERLDAADDLDDDHGTEGTEALEVLRDVMVLSWETAQSRFKSINATIKDQFAPEDQDIEVGDGLQMEIRHELKALTAANKKFYLSHIQKVVTEHFRRRYEGFAAEGGDVESYVVGCTEVAWLIALTSPSMSLVTETGVPFDPKRHTLSAECKKKEGAPVTKYLWPGLASDGSKYPEVKGTVITGDKPENATKPVTPASSRGQSPQPPASTQSDVSKRSASAEDPKVDPKSSNDAATSLRHSSSSANESALRKSVATKSHSTQGRLSSLNTSSATSNDGYHNCESLGDLQSLGSSLGSPGRQQPPNNLSHMSSKSLDSDDDSYHADSGPDSSGPTALPFDTQGAWSADKEGGTYHHQTDENDSTSGTADPNSPTSRSVPLATGRDDEDSSISRTRSGDEDQSPSRITPLQQGNRHDVVDDKSDPYGGAAGIGTDGQGDR